MGRVTRNLLLAAVAVPLGLLAGAAAAQPFMPHGARSTQPIGHYDFCQRVPSECRQVSQAQKPVELTPELWEMILKVNHHVNRTVSPRTDWEMWGVEEHWSYPVNGQGDCEDYVLEKRRLLAEIGVPIGDLLITVVRQPNGDGHAVLTVRTSLGDFILDNMESKVLRWNETQYQYLKRQSELHSGVWISIGDDRQMLVGSVRGR